MTDEQFTAGIMGQMRVAPAMALDAASRIVVVSDLHMGDGSANDDLRRNGELLASALERRYLEGGSTLILNGDIEDLQKFPSPGSAPRGVASSRSSTASPARAGSTRYAGTTTTPCWRPPAIPIHSTKA